MSIWDPNIVERVAIGDLLVAPKDRSRCDEPDGEYVEMYGEQIVLPLPHIPAADVLRARLIEVYFKRHQTWPSRVVVDDLVKAHRGKV